MSDPLGAGRVAYLVRSWPRLSQTFILNEVLALERLGVDLLLFSLSRSGEAVVQGRVRDVRAPVSYLDERRRGRVRAHARLLAASPGRYLGTAWLALTRPGLSAGYATCTTRACFLHAVTVTAALLDQARSGAPVTHLHAHFAHDPALVAWFVHRLTGVPYSLTAHARDLYQVPAAALAARASAARAVVTCCPSNADYARSVLPRAAAGRLRMIPHGVDVARFVPVDRSGRSAAPLVLSVGRLVEKKGFPDLLHACALLHRSGRSFRLRIYGDGPLRGQLVDLRDRLGLAAVVDFAGECPQEVLLGALAEADVFALTPVVTADGDRDGVPNVLVEAMAQGLPVVTTGAGGVPDLVRDGENGLLAAPGDLPAIAARLDVAISDPAYRARLGAAARRTVESGYDVSVAARELAAVFGTRR